MMRMIRTLPGVIILLILLLTKHSAEAQIVHPDPGMVFDDTEVPRIDLAISASNLASLYADPESNDEYFATFTFSRGTSVEGPFDTGIRFRGDTIRHKQKKSFRISFNSLVAGGDFHGIEKMNLNAEVNDPSLIRSKLAYSLMRRFGVAAPRVNHVLLYINNDFYGVYLNTEQVDENFVKSRFDTNDGNLFRCQDQSDLSYLGPNQDYYKFEVDGARSYALRTNEDWDDYADLEDFIKTLEDFAGEQLKTELEKLMNIQQYLKVLAADVMTGNWDGYAGSSNNFYLYRDQLTGRFEHIPYSLENSSGIDFDEVDWSSRSIYNWYQGQRPLVEKVLQVEEYKEQYTAYIKEAATYLSSSALVNEMGRWRILMSPYLATDPYYSLDWGFSYADFEAAMTTGWGEHVELGVQSFLDIRISSALAECIDVDAMPLISHARLSPLSTSVGVDWTAEDDQPGLTSTLHYRIDEGSWEMLVRDTPTETDLISGSLIYRDTIRSLGDGSVLDVYFTVLDAGGQENRYPDSYLTVSYPLVSGPLYINEFMASNQSTKKDEYGEYDDWVEIYNNGNEQLLLSDYYLSDKMGDPGKYRFPGEILQPGEFFLVWLDGSPDQGVTHASFKISKEGEELRLSEGPAAGYALMDSIKFGLQQTDVSLGRAADADIEWVAFQAPTPDYSNLRSGRDELKPELETLSLFPNPVSDGFFHLNKRVTGGIYNLMGQKVLSVEDAQMVSVSGLSEGVYLLKTLEGETITFLVMP